MIYLGDFPTGETIYIPWHTFDSNDPSASVTMTGLALADIKVYKDGGTTQRSSTAGFTLLDTDGTDFDTITGIHGISIDTSDNTDAGFYAAGSDYWVVIDNVTVDAATISFLAAIFSIDNRGLLRPTTAQRTLDVTATGAAGVDWGNVENASTSVDLSATSINLCDTTTTNTDMVSAAPSAASIADAVWDETVNTGTHNTANTAGYHLRRGAQSTAILHEGTAQAGANSTITLAAGAEGTNNDLYEDALISIIAGTGVGQVRAIVDYVASTRVATVHEDWVVNPSTDSEYVVAGSSVANVHAIGDSATAAANLLADYDGTGYDKSNSTIGTCTTNTDMRGTDSANTTTPPTAAAIADAVWDETQSEHTSAGTTGESLNDAGSAGDPWSTSVPGAYGAGTAGYILGTNMDAPVSTVDTNVDAILADTGTDGVAVSSTAATEIADALLNRDMSAVSDTTARSPLNALRLLRNKYSVSGSTLTVTKEDDSTSAWTATLTTDATADPVTGSDPA